MGHILFWEGNSNTVTQKTLCLSENLKVHFYFTRAHHWSLSPDTCIQSTCDFRKIHFNINLPSMHVSSKWSLPFRFSNHHFINSFHLSCMCQASLAQAMGCMAGVWFLAGARDFSLLHSVQIVSGAHPIFYPMGNAVCFPVDKAARAWSWSFSSI
jgi:hypothetical protein